MTRREKWLIWYAAWLGFYLRSALTMAADNRAELGVAYMALVAICAALVLTVPKD